MARVSTSYRIARKLDLVGSPGTAGEGGDAPERNAPSPLSTFLPWLLDRGRRRQRRLAGAATTTTELDFAIDKVGDLISATRSLHLPADGRWHDLEIDLRPGQGVVILAAGRLFLSRPLEVSVGARTSLWYRIGDGNVQRVCHECQQVIVRRAGRIALRAAIPGAFDSRSGDDNPDNPQPRLSGGLDVRIIRWKGNPASATVEAENRAPDVFKPAREPHTDIPAPPEGWHYYWRMGQADIFHRCADGGALCCDTRGDVGILQFPVNVALDAQLRLSWAWCAEALPSKLSEHIQPTHDYLSIAVEFDNGLDLTYMWSASLPEGTIFQCPLPWWDQRETHWVLRNARAGLNCWHDERRSLRDDYRRAIGGRLPKRVVAVWLIANSVFQNGQGRCRYRGISLEGGSETIAIHP